MCIRDSACGGLRGRPRPPGREPPRDEERRGPVLRCHPRRQDDIVHGHGVGHVSKQVRATARVVRPRGHGGRDGSDAGPEQRSILGRRHDVVGDAPVATRSYRRRWNRRITFAGHLSGGYAACSASVWSSSVGGGPIDARRDPARDQKSCGVVLRGEDRAANRLPKGPRVEGDRSSGQNESGFWGQQ